CLGPLQLASEGEIILSSNGSELGCRSIIHAGGAGGIRHSGGWTMGCDVQPTITSSNMSSKTIILTSSLRKRLDVPLINLRGVSCEFTLQSQCIAQTAGLGHCRIALAGDLGNDYRLPVDLPPEQARYQQQGRDHA